MASWTTKRRARKRHRCETENYPEPCTRLIEPGEEYLEHRAAPGHVDNPTWWRVAECQPCAEAMGRWPK